MRFFCGIETIRADAFSLRKQTGITILSQIGKKTSDLAEYEPGCISCLVIEVAAWQYHAKASSVRVTQIDLLIDRADNAIKLCELSFSDDSFVTLRMRDGFSIRIGRRFALP